MREILFRGKTLDGGTWIRGYFVEMEGLPCIFVNGGAVRVVPETVGQFTGLRDRNGLEIFEGDIVMRDCGGYSVSCGVTFKDGCFGLMTSYAWTSLDGETGVDEVYHAFYDNDREEAFDSKRRLEVVGNIYDVPELLEDNLL